MRLLSSTTFALLLLSATAFAGGGDKGGKAPPPDTKTTEIKKPEPPPAPEIPDPAPELLAAAKVMKGTWSCKGTVSDPTGAKSNIKGTIKWSLDLDKMWLKGVMALGKMKGQKRGYKTTFYRSFVGGTWNHLAIGNMGDWGSGTSTGPDAEGKTTFVGTANAGGMSWQTKDYEQAGEKKGTFHIWGDASMDGKTFQPAYDMTCKK